MKRARKCGAGRGGGSGSNRLRRMAIPPPSDTMTRREHIEIVIMDWIESERVRTMATVQKKNLKNNRQRARVVERTYIETLNALVIRDGFIRLGFVGHHHPQRLLLLHRSSTQRHVENHWTIKTVWLAGEIVSKNHASSIPEIPWKRKRSGGRRRLKLMDRIQKFVVPTKEASRDGNVRFKQIEVDLLSLSVVTNSHSDCSSNSEWDGQRQEVHNRVEEKELRENCPDPPSRLWNRVIIWFLSFSL